MIRISVVDFLNARPLTWGLLHEPPDGVSVSRDAPSICAAKLASGEADVGLIPSIECQRIPGVSVVARLGIAASSEVRSVLLVSDVSRERIRSVDLDPASRTSAALTRILLKRVYGLQPEYRDAGTIQRGPGPASSHVSRLTSHVPADARLIIGDPALKTRLNGHVVLDLAAEWRAYTGRSFVFAVWAVRDGADAELAGRAVRASRARSVSEFSRVVREGAGETGLSEAVVEDYLRHSLHFELSPEDVEGMELFYRLAAEEGLIEGVRRLSLL